MFPVADSRVQKDEYTTRLFKKEVRASGLTISCKKAGDRFKGLEVSKLEDKPKVRAALQGLEVVPCKCSSEAFQIDQHPSHIFSKLSTYFVLAGWLKSEPSNQKNSAKLLVDSKAKIVRGLPAVVINVFSCRHSCGVGGLGLHKIVLKAGHGA